MKFPYCSRRLTFFTFTKRRLSICLALTAFALSAALAGAGPPMSTDPKPRLDLSSMVCVELADTLEPPRAWIPVGCETRLCCPGCPEQPIDWHIRVSGEPLESALLDFENLSPQAARKLKIRGNARWEGRALRVLPGETIVSGFKHDPRATPVVAKPRLFGNRERLTALSEAASAGTDRTLGRMELFVEQMMGQYAVSEARVAYNVKRCPLPPANGDRILLNNNAGNDNAITMIDARNGSGNCLNDQDFRGVGVVSVGDLRNSDNCASDTSIFSDDNGMFFLSPASWTDLRDEPVATLPSMFRAPVAVWIAIDESGAQERAEWDMATANFLYNRNNVGFAFDATYTSALQLAAIARENCANAGRIRESSFFRPDRLNVYYIDNWTEMGLLGKTCWNEADNKPVKPGMIFVNRWAPPETLAHEFGHAFSLDDLNLLDWSVTNGIDPTNIMWKGNRIRTDFTIGQAFRMNVNNTSMINVNVVRSGWATRDCPDATVTERCPRLDRDVPAPK